MSDVDPSADTAAWREALKAVIDPEVGVNIVDLGLVYRIEVEADRLVVEMTMTSPACPMGEMITAEVEAVLQPLLPETLRADVRLVWSPAWEPTLMSDEAKKHFGW